ncbi:hypothetical protein Tco_0808055 [Tanacetum coccineum]
MKLIQFLMRLDYSYMQLRSNILSRDPLPNAKCAYILISSEESHRAIVTGSGAGSSQRAQSSVFNCSINNKSGVQRSQTFGNTTRPNNTNGNRRTVSGPTLVYEHCGFNGHTIDRCFKLIAPPLLFSNEQISKLISLIKENSLSDNGKGFQANMAGANQDLTYNNKHLVNVIDISYLRIKVDRDNKFIVGFDESKYFLMSQDLMDVKIMRIGVFFDLPNVDVLDGGYLDLTLSSPMLKM